MSKRIYNFSAGPAVLPESVIKNVQNDIWNIADSGIGIMEHSHRGKLFERVLNEAEADCRAICNMPDNYRVLFLQGGASMQFAMIPANFLAEDRTADYMDTGIWTHKSIKEAKFYGKVNVAASSEDKNYSYIPEPDEITYSDAPAYVHFASNNTVFGTQFPYIPTCPNDSFLICDTSSDMFSKQIDISRYGMIYAGAQKNLGPSGVALIIIREDLVENAVRPLPSMLSYKCHSDAGSRYNTPPAHAIYVMGQVFKWILNEGGLDAMATHNEAKAKKIYDAIDESTFFKGAAEVESRSLMNVAFRTPTEELDAKFVTEALAAGFSGLKGHRATGGMRASIYNAFPAAGCEALAQFMRQFEAENAKTAEAVGH